MLPQEEEQPLCRPPIGATAVTPTDKKVKKLSKGMSTSLIYLAQFSNSLPELT